MNETVLVSGQDAVYRHLDGERPTLVLVHGAGGNHASWDALTVHLGGQEMIIPALPGRCGSGGRPLTTVEDMASWLRKLLRAVGTRRVVVAGHSLGGAVALEYALQEREGNGTPELAGLVLVATGAKLRVRDEILRAVADAAELDLPAELSPDAFEKDPDPAVVRQVELTRERTGARATLIDWEASNRFDRMRDLGDVRCPTLVVSGSEDRLTPEKYARYLAQNIPGAKLEMIYGGSHMCPVERPAEVAKLLRDFATSL